MKTMRIPLLIAWGVAVIGIILGSFFDLQISTAIASPNNSFALAISAVGPTFGFAGVSLIGGGFIALALKGKYHIALKILFYALALACFGVSIYYPGREYFGINGFYGAAPEWAGYFIVLLPAIGGIIGGYFLFKDFQNKNLWIVLLIIVALLLVALLVVIPTLKDNMHRPRYRFLMDGHQDMFHKWFEPFKEYKNYIASNPSIPHDNFKSYPSGHTAEASILLVTITFLPLANKKYEKIQLPLFIGACALVVIVAFARILAAAHFLSDVSFGAVITITLLLIANEIVMRIKALQIQEEVPEQQ